MAEGRLSEVGYHPLFNMRIQTVLLVLRNDFAKVPM